MNRPNAFVTMPLAFGATCNAWHHRYCSRCDGPGPRPTGDHCPECGCQPPRPGDPTPPTTAPSARRVARKYYGWACDTKGDYCPQHRKDRGQ